MIDLMQAVQDAVFAVLKAGVDPQLAGVFQHVPENTQPPMVIVGTIDSVNEGGKFEQLERITVEIQSVFRGPSRARLFDIMATVRTLLDQQALAHADAQFSDMRFVSASTSDAASDGITYAGIQLFEVFAEPA